MPPPLHAPLLLPLPLCIIHHRGLLPCFPGLFLPSMPVTLTESPNPLLLQTASLPPSGSWITSLFFYPFSHSWYFWAPSFPLSFYPHFCFFTTPQTLPLSTPVLFLVSFNHSHIVFPVPREYSLHISSERSHCLLSCSNSVADIASCTYQSLSQPHSKILWCWHEVWNNFQTMHLVICLYGFDPYRYIR